MSLRKSKCWYPNDFFGLGGFWAKVWNKESLNRLYSVRWGDSQLTSDYLVLLVMGVSIVWTNDCVHFLKHAVPLLA